MLKVSSKVMCIQSIILKTYTILNINVVRKILEICIKIKLYKAVNTYKYC